MKRIAVINGPNMNLLGRRQPDIYGSRTLDDICEELRLEFADVEFEFFQSNHEGALIDELHRLGYDDPVDGIVLNAGACTHTSLALADAIAAIPQPVVEVHMTNVMSREPVRHHSCLTPVCAGIIAGFGARVYSLAVRSLI